MEKPIRILAVDDEESFTFFVKLNLESNTIHDFKVITAARGEEGLNLAKPDRKEGRVKRIETTLNLSQG